MKIGKFSVKLKWAREFYWWNRTVRNPNTKSHKLAGIEFHHNQKSGRRSFDVYLLPIHFYVFWFGKKIAEDLEDDLTDYDY